MAIDGNRAVIGFNDTVSGLGPLTVEVVDNAATGAPDTLFADVASTDCAGDPALSTGGDIGPDDLAVRTARVETAMSTRRLAQFH